MSETAAFKAVTKIKNHFSSVATSIISFHGEETLIVPADSLYEILLWARDHAQFDLLLDLTGIDNLGADNRFDLSYVLSRSEEGTNIIIKSSLPGTTALSVTSIWKTADWHEREVYDLMGITFENHPDMRRLLMWDGYPYHPLRKDFPLAGLPTELEEVAKSETAPWEGGPFVSTPSEYCAGREPHPIDVQTSCAKGSCS